MSLHFHQFQSEVNKMKKKVLHKSKEQQRVLLITESLQSVEKIVSLMLYACSHPFPSLLPQAFHGKQHHRNVLSSSSSEKQTISRVCLGFGERTLVSWVDRRSLFPGEEIFLGAQFWSGVFRWQTDGVLNRGYNNWVRSQTMVELFTDMISNRGRSSSHHVFLYRPSSFLQ